VARWRRGSVAEKLEGYLTGIDDTRLYWRGWLPDGPVAGVVLLCHGGGEHSGRYQNVVDMLAPDGWAVYGMDQRGHGRSHGARAHVKRFFDWVHDFDLFRREVISRHPDLSIFILGQGLGGQIALASALDHQEASRGLVLSAPLLAVPLSRVAVQTAKAAASVVPRARVKLVDLKKISKDANVVRRYQRDPFVYHGNITLAMAHIIESRFEELIERSYYLRIPVLIQHGDQDAIADPGGSWRLYEACGSSDLTFFLYRGLWHELYNEPERQRPLGDLREWLADHR
jgi:acylglycerol lipase